jgi:hypothetical protein
MLFNVGNSATVAANVLMEASVSFVSQTASQGNNEADQDNKDPNKRTNASLDTKLDIRTQPTVKKLSISTKRSASSPRNQKGCVL